MFLVLNTRNYLSNSFKQSSIEGGSCKNRLREARRSGDQGGEMGPGTNVGDSMQRLRPPLIARDAEPGHSSSLIHQEPDLLRQCEPAHQVGHPCVDGDRRVAESEGGYVWVGRCVAGEDWGLS